MRPDGIVEVLIGTLSAGQGHATSYAQLVTEWLGIPADKVRVELERYRPADGGRRLAFRPLASRWRRRRSTRPRNGIIAKGLKLAAQRSRGERSRHRLRRRPLHGERDGSQRRAVRPRSEARRDRRCGRRRQPCRLLSLWLACLRGRGRCRDRRGEDRALHHHRRCRPRREPADPARPDPWRHRPGRRARR